MHLDEQYQYEGGKHYSKMEDDRISGLYVLKADVGAKSV